LLFAPLKNVLKCGSIYQPALAPAFFVNRKTGDK
jgi:hypothetical protein